MQRKDLLGFLDSLYAGAIALGIAAFFQQLATVKPENPDEWWKNPAISLMVLVPAIAIVVDDWRYARWLNSDYGLRLQTRAPAFRFWLDCAMATCSFFLVSLAVFSPRGYLIGLLVFYILGLVWSYCLANEINASVRATGAYPGNSLGIAMVHVNKGQRPSDVDYRVALAPLPLGLELLVLVIFLFFVIRNSTPSALSSNEAVLYTSGVPLGLLAWDKIWYHFQRKEILRKLDCALEVSDARNSLQTPLWVKWFLGIWALVAFIAACLRGFCYGPFWLCFWFGGVIAPTTVAAITALAFVIQE